MSLGSTRYVSETPVSAHIEKRRGQCRSMAARGEDPRSRFTEEALAELFTEDELKKLDQERIDTIKRSHEAKIARQVQADLAEMTEQVLQEWDQKRRQEAEAEARRRLGLREGVNP